MNTAQIPAVLPVARESLVRRGRPPFWVALGHETAGLLGWVWRILIGAWFCLNYVSSILVVGLTYRWMQAVVLRGWWKQSSLRAEVTFEEFCAGLGPDAPVTRPRWFWRHRIAAHLARPLPGGRPPGTLRRGLRILALPFGSLWLNFKTGIQALFCTYLLTGWGCLMMLFSWEFGWLNSFYKGYEQFWVGPVTGWAGIFLFIAAMFYVPMAQAHQAATGDYRAFFDFRFVGRLIRARLTAYLLLAGLFGLISLPLEILKTFPAASDMWLNQETLADAEVLHNLRVYLFWTAVLLFVSLLVLRLTAALVYRSAVLKVLRRGEVNLTELHPVLAGWLRRLDLDLTPRVVRPGLWEAVRFGGSRFYRGMLYFLLVGVWLLFVGKVYVGEFFNYHPAAGFLNHVTVQFPCVDYVPGHLRP